MKTKFYNLLVLAGIICTNAFAQPLIKKQIVAGGSLDDKLTSEYVTKDGGLIAGGYSKSKISGEKTGDRRGANDYWIVKLDELGKIQWDKTIGGSKEDQLYAILQTSDNGYVLGGSSFSDKSGEKTANSRGSYDYWIIKLNGNGNIQWDKTIGGSSGDFLSSLQQTSDGGYVIGGYSFSNRSGEKTQNSRGNIDYWIVKLDGLGNIQWDKTIGGDNIDELTALQQTNDGGYILGGWSVSNISGEKTESSKGFQDYWVVKLDASGNIQWDKTIGGFDLDELYSLQQTSDGGYILGGSSGSFSGGNVRDYWIVKLDASGIIQWHKDIGGNDNDYLRSVQQTIDGGYIVGGYSYSGISGQKTEGSKGNADYWVIKLNSQGKIQWDKTIGGNDFDYLMSIKEMEKNVYVLGGYSISGISGNKTQSSRGGFDYWLVWLLNKTGGHTVAEENKNIAAIPKPNTNTNTFSIYPNPAKDILHIQTSGKATLSLTHQSGKLLLTKTITNKGEINIAALPAGIYFLKNNETGAVKKVVLER